MTDIDWGTEITKYAGRLAEMWQYKAPAAAAFAAFCAWCGVDATLVLLAASFLSVESVLRILVYSRRGRHLCRGLQRALARFVCYGCAFALSVFVQTVFFHSFKVSVPLADWILGWIILTDMSSTISYLHILGIKLPAPLLRMVHRGKREIERKMDGAAARRDGE